MGLSSTTRACRPCRSPDTGMKEVEASLANSNLASNVNVLPRPGWLSTQIRPPIISTSCRLMARPRPVPPKRRVVESSACEKGWNSRAICSAVMPIPESRTAKRKVTSFTCRLTSSVDTTMSPCSVNLRALLVRLVSTCESRSGSPTRRVGTPPGAYPGYAAPRLWSNGHQ